MLKHAVIKHPHGKSDQPPSGGCVLKPPRDDFRALLPYQPPSGGCVLKRDGKIINPQYMPQPPSGGCVLKLANGENS